MRKNDIILIAIVLVTVLIWGVWQYFITAEHGAEIRISQNGEETAVLSLSDEGEHVFTDAYGGNNILIIRNEEAYIYKADCPDKICVRQKAVSKKGESIICLPHRLVIEVISGKEAETDAVVR